MQFSAVLAGSPEMNVDRLAPSTLRAGAMFQRAIHAIGTTVSRARLCTFARPNGEGVLGLRSVACA